MKKAKLKRDNRPQKKGFFKEKYIDISRNGDTLIFSDTSLLDSIKAKSEYVSNLNFICFENSSGDRTTINIREGTIDSCIPFTNIPSVDNDTLTSRNAIASLCENIAEQVVGLETNLPQTLLNRIDYLEYKIRILEDRILSG
jgi:hypothetical protein